jgi:uncharacterized protein YciW
MAVGRADHLRAAVKNKDLANFLIQHGEHQWAVVLAFYSALHFVEAYLAESGLSAGTHTERGNQMVKISALRGIHDHYRALQTRSEWVRYELKELSPKEVEALMNKNLQAIEQHIRQLLT